MSQSIEISVVSPMHNEAASVHEFVSRTHAALSAMNTSFEILVVNDGSTDTTEALLRERIGQFPGLKVVNLSRNCGQWAATYAGMQASVGKYVVVMDSDLQHAPEEIRLLVEKIREGFALVSGARQGRQDSFLFRRIPSKIANYLLRKITQCPAKDMGGFKCIDGEIARNLHLKAGQHRLLPALVWMQGGPIAEVPITCHDRFAGESHYGLSRTFDVLFDIVLFWVMNSFKSRQVYLFGHIWFWMSAFSTLIMAWVFFEKFALGIDLGNRPPFFIALSGYFMAFGFLSLGFILELLSDNLNQTAGKRPYQIKEILS